MTTATIALRDGSRLKRAVRDNAIFARLPSQAVALSWADDRGRVRRQALPGGPQPSALGAGAG